MKTKLFGILALLLTTTSANAMFVTALDCKNVSKQKLFASSLKVMIDTDMDDESMPESIKAFYILTFAGDEYGFAGNFSIQNENYSGNAKATINGGMPIAIAVKTDNKKVTALLTSHNVEQTYDCGTLEE